MLMVVKRFMWPEGSASRITSDGSVMGTSSLQGQKIGGGGSQARCIYLGSAYAGGPVKKIFVLNGEISGNSRGILSRARVSPRFRIGQINQGHGLLTTSNGVTRAFLKKERGKDMLHGGKSDLVGKRTARFSAGMGFPWTAIQPSFMIRTISARYALGLKKPVTTELESLGGLPSIIATKLVAFVAFSVRNAISLLAALATTLKPFNPQFPIFNTTTLREAAA